jgi:hypothetical protein
MIIVVIMKEVLKYLEVCVIILLHPYLTYVVCRVVAHYTLVCFYAILHYLGLAFSPFCVCGRNGNGDFAISPIFTHPITK